MLSELGNLQSSDESVYTTGMTIDIETRSEDGDELVHSEYKFAYAKEWDKWTFVEYIEKRTPDTEQIGDRNWRDAEHIFWQDVSETRRIDVPPEVADSLAEATGADSVTIQVPANGLDESRYEQVY